MSYKATHWSLSDLFPGYDSPELQAAFDRVEELVASFEGARLSLQPDIDASTFLQIVRSSEEIKRVMSRLYGFAVLSFAADTQDQAAQTLQARVDLFSAETNNRMLFFQLWWKQLDEPNAQRLLAVSDDYCYYLEQMRKQQPYTLSEPEEKIINVKNVTGANALNMLYDTITTRYTFKLTVDGEVRELTRGQLIPYILSPNPDLRKAAYEELLRVYSPDTLVLGQIYQNLVRDWHNENISMRKYPSALGVRNRLNDIPDEAVDVLLDVCRKNAVIFQRYYRMKARHVGMDKLRRYDIYAPIRKSEKRYEFAQAAEIVFDAFRQFDPQLAEMAQRVFDAHHLDSEPRKGKDNGAFCASVLPEMTPYVLLTYEGQPNDVATLAHELGHAIHAMLAAHHNTFSFEACLPLAETASTFGEMLLTDYLLARENDESVRRELLFKQMDDSFGTITRQIYFALFEQRAHQMVQEHASVDDLSAMHLELQKEQFGDSLDFPEDFKMEWVSIPHFYHWPFYVYAYAFGQLLVLSLYQQYKQEGESFKPRYLKILAAGGSQAPASVLGEAGIDIRSADFWQAGFDVLDRLEQQLEKLSVQ